MAEKLQDTESQIEVITDDMNAVQSQAIERRAKERVDFQNKIRQGKK